jgi:uncharacterized membrane protein YesL
MVGNILAVTARLVWRRLGLLVPANVLWLVLSLPIVTWPAATAGLFTIVRRVVQEELEAAPREARLGDFWAGFRQQGLRGSLLVVMALAGLGIVGVAMRFYGGSAEPLRWLIGPIGLIGLTWLGAQLYAFPLLLQRPARPAWEVLREALLIAISHPLSSLSLLATSLVLGIAAVALAGPVLLVFFSAMAVLQTVTVRRLLIDHGEMGMVVP